MPRFYFDLNECGTFTRDEEGVELAGLAEAREHAVTGARAVMADEVLSGSLCLGCCVIVREGETEAFRVPFREAINVSNSD